MESEPLVQVSSDGTGSEDKKKAGFCNGSRYWQGCARNKGVVLLMTWTFFWSCARYFCGNISIVVKEHVFNNIAYGLYLICPVLAGIADSWLGRYRVIVASVYATLLGWILQAVGYALLSNPGIPLLGTVFMYSGLVVYLIGDAGFQANLLPFLLDQSVGASVKELTGVVHWWYWSREISFILSVLLLFSFSGNSTGFWWLSLLYLLLILPCLLVLVVSQLVIKDWLVTDLLISNPIKRIAKVINYARKNKYPRSQDEENDEDVLLPSRLDVGKNKYGGPFSEDEVEDVKTVLRLLPLLVCMTAFGFTETGVALSHHYTPTLAYLNVVASLGDLGPSIMVVIFIPSYHSYFLPCLYRCMPSMLRMGAGLFLLVLAQCVYVILELVGHSMNPRLGCVFTPIDHSQTQVMPVSVGYTIIPFLLNGLGELLLVLSSLEFIVTQLPAHMRGLLIGLWYAMNGITTLLGLNLYHPFSHITSSSFSCGFYYFLTKLVLFVLLLVFFLVLSKKYRLREGRHS